MNKLDKLKKEHLQARKDKNGIKTNVLGTLLGEIQTKLIGTTTVDVDELVEYSAKKMYNSVEDSLKVSEMIDVREALQEELTYIEPFLPQTMSESEIRAELANMNLDDLPNFGARMGAAMKALKGKADGNDVKRLVSKFYN